MDPFRIDFFDVLSVFLFIVLFAFFFDLIVLLL